MNKSLNILFICFVALLVISCVNAANDNQDNSGDISNYQISSDLSNTEIQTMLDNAKEGDQFEFTDREYKNISLVVDKKLNIVSKKSSSIHTSNKITDKARDLGLNNSFGFYFTSNSGGSFLYGLTIMSNSDYGIVVDKSDNTTIKNVVIKNGNVGILVKNSNNADIIHNNISKANSMVFI